MAVTNNCLAQRSTICTRVNATNKQPAARRDFVGVAHWQVPVAGQCYWSARKGAGGNLVRTSCDVARHRQKKKRYFTEWRRGLTRQVFTPFWRRETAGKDQKCEQSSERATR